MAKTGFYNDNRFRSFPFLKGEVGDTGAGDVRHLPNNAIVDVGFVFGLNAGFVAGTHNVWLSRVSRVNDWVYFDFKSDAPGIADKTIRFSRDVTDLTWYVLEYNDNESQSESSETIAASDAEAYDDPLMWSGFLVTGRLDDLSSLIADGEQWTGAAVLEPSLLRSETNTFVSSINVANADRTRVDGAKDCDPPSWSDTIGENVVHVHTAGLQGDVRLKPGYNAKVRQVDSDNRLEISAIAGAGEGRSCDEIPAYPGEVAPAGRQLLDGSRRCNEVLRSINGVGGQLFSLISGAGVEISTIPHQHKVVINVSMQEMAVCYDVEAVSETVD